MYNTSLQVCKRLPQKKKRSIQFSMTTTEERRISVGTVTPAFRQVCWPDNSDTTIYFFEAVNPDDIMEMKEFDKVGCLVF